MQEFLKHPESHQWVFKKKNIPEILSTDVHKRTTLYNISRKSKGIIAMEMKKPNNYLIRIFLLKSLQYCI